MSTELATAPRMCYVGLCPKCGRWRAVCSDRPEWINETARDVADFVRRGLRVEHMEIDRFNSNFADDPCAGHNPKQLSLLEDQ